MRRTLVLLGPCVTLISALITLAPSSVATVARAVRAARPLPIQPITHKPCTNRTGASADLRASNVLMACARAPITLVALDRPSEHLHWAHCTIGFLYSLSLGLSATLRWLSKCTLFGAVDLGTQVDVFVFKYIGTNKVRVTSAFMDLSSLYVHEGDVSRPTIFEAVAADEMRALLYNAASHISHVPMMFALRQGHED